VQAQLDRIELNTERTLAAVTHLAATTADQFAHQEDLIKQLSDQIAAIPGGGGTIPPTVVAMLQAILVASKAARVGHTQAFGGRMTIDAQP
jgi:hypothetical protein